MEFTHDRGPRVVHRTHVPRESRDTAGSWIGPAKTSWSCRQGEAHDTGVGRSVPNAWIGTNATYELRTPGVFEDPGQDPGTDAGHANVVLGSEDVALLLGFAGPASPGVLVPPDLVVLL